MGIVMGAGQTGPWASSSERGRPACCPSGTLRPFLGRLSRIQERTLRILLQACRIQIRLVASGAFLSLQGLLGAFLIRSPQAPLAGRSLGIQILTQARWRWSASLSLTHQ